MKYSVCRYSGLLVTFLGTWLSAESAFAADAPAGSAKATASPAPAAAKASDAKPAAAKPASAAEKPAAAPAIAPVAAPSVPAPNAAPAPVNATAPAPTAANAETPAAAPVTVSTEGAPSATPPVAVAVAPAPVAEKPKAPEGKLGTLTPEQKQWARKRFDRGLELYDAGDFAGALKEFQAALQVARHPIVLYNVALVLARLGSPVECVRAVDELKTAGFDSLDNPSRERLSAVYDEQRSRIGKLQVKANVDGALIQIDGVDIGQREVSDLQLASGEHVVSTVASGYIPRRLRVFVPAQGQEVVNLTLQPLQTTLAHLEIQSEVPDVEVSVDGEPVGRTPFPASLAFSPGPHQVSAKREGYQDVKQNVLLDPGGAGHIKLQMNLDEAAPAPRGKLTLDVSEPNSFVTINGNKLGIGRNQLQLPVGRHHLGVHSAGFVDYERDVVVTPGEQTTRIELMPTSEFLTDYQSSAASQRLWGFISLGAGVVVAAGGAGFLIWNSGQKQDRHDAYQARLAEVAATPAGECSNPACAEQLDNLASRERSAKSRDVVGWVGIGVGAGLAALGGSLLIFGDDPNRYAPRRESDVFGSLRFRVGPNQALLTGQF